MLHFLFFNFFHSLQVSSVLVLDWTKNQYINCAQYLYRGKKFKGHRFWSVVISGVGLCRPKQWMPPSNYRCFLKQDLSQKEDNKTY